MTSFKPNKIFLDSETVSEQLRSARQAKKIKVETAAKKLGINPQYIYALEKGEQDKLPRGVYGKNFLREYSVYLGLDYDEIKKNFEKELEFLKEENDKNLFSRQIVKKHYFLAIPKIIKNSIIFTIVFICFSYLGYSMKKNFSAPSLFIETPMENMVTSEKMININGKTEAESQVIINGEQILSDNSGRFSEKINLKDGVNTITITAKRKYGGENTVKRQILVKES